MRLPHQPVTKSLMKDAARTAVWVVGSSAFLIALGCDARPAVQASPVAASSALPVSSFPPASSLPSSSSPSEIKTFTTTGPLVAEQQADIGAERDGRVARISVEIGDHVRRGQTLALLDDRALRAAVDVQKAKVASLHAQVAEWQSQQKTEEADLRRADIMRKEKIRSEEDWEHVKYKLEETIDEVSRYRAEEAGAEAELTAATLQLEQSNLTAPFAGVVGRASIRLDQEVKKGDVLFWVTAEAPLRVLFTVPESVMSAFLQGAPLVLTTADYPSLRQTAHIQRVSPVVDPASGSVQVIGAVVNPSPLLKPGMSMQVRLAP